MKDYHKAMYTARRHINRREVIVGWFSTTTEEGQTINDNSTLIHEFYEKECGGSSPIHLVVDTTLNGDLMGVRAFLSAPMTAGIHKFADMFHELKVDTEMSPSEVVCISQMTAGQKYVSKPWASSAVVAGIPPASQALNESIEKLLDLIDKIQEYVKGVVEGREISDPDVGMALADILGAAHSIKLQDFQTLFQSKTQDLLMTTYLTTLVQNQLAIAERLHEII
jgi:translation initiation factor 3 subunit F